MTFRHTAALLVLVGLSIPSRVRAADPAQVVKKLKDVVVYRDDTFYNAFPSIVRRPDGELLVAFRRAPDARSFGDFKYTHTDPKSHLVLVRSTDNGETWTKSP